MKRNFLFIFLLLTSAQLFAQQEWQGYYAGLDINRQYMFGEARVNSRRIVGEGTSWALGAVIGHNWHSLHNTIFGIEFQINQPFADFINDNNAEDAVIRYSLRQQTAFQIHLGKSFGKVNQHLPLGYFSMTQTRLDIDVTQTQGAGPRQQIEENFFRYGVGYNYKLFQNLIARMLIGTSFDLKSNTENGLDMKLTVVGKF